MHVAILGAGRIGKQLCLSLRASNQDQVSRISLLDVYPVKRIWHSLKFDSTYGWSDLELASQSDDTHIMAVDSQGEQVHLYTSPKDQDMASWLQQQQVDLIIDATGRKLSKRQIHQLYLGDSHRKIILTHPDFQVADSSIIAGVNDQELLPSHQIISAASCTSCALAPVLKVLLAKFGIRWLNTLTLHAAMGDQPTLDKLAINQIGALDASSNMLPIPTQLNTGMIKFFPELQGVYPSSGSLRIPMIRSCAIELQAELANTPDHIDQVHNALDAQHGIEISDESIGSSQAVGFPANAWIDQGQSRLDLVQGHSRLRLLLWFDNEFGYCQQVLKLLPAIDTALSTNS